MLLHLFTEIFDHATVEVLTAKVSITCGGYHLEHTFFEFQDRNIKCAATQIENQDRLFFSEFLLKTISQSSCSWLTYDSLNFKACYLGCNFCSLSLMVTKMRRHSDHCLFNSFLSKFFNICFNLAQDHSGYLLGTEALRLTQILDFNLRTKIFILNNFKWKELQVFLNLFIIIFESKKPFGIIDSILRIFGGLIVGCLSDQSSFIIEADHGWHDVSAVLVYDFDSIIPPNPHTRIRRPQINPHRYTCINNICIHHNNNNYYFQNYYFICFYFHKK